MLETILIWTGFLALELAMCALIIIMIIGARPAIEILYSRFFEFYFLCTLEKKLTFEERKFIKETIRKYSK